MKKKPENKKATGKYASMYMLIGMCIGIGIGMCLGNVIFDNIGIGMCFGIGIGFLLGFSYGSSLDKKALNVVEIIEDDIVPEIEEIKTRDDKEIKKAIIEESIDLNDIKKKTKNNLWYVLLPIAFAIAFVLVLKKR